MVLTNTVKPWNYSRKASWKCITTIWRWGKQWRRALGNGFAKSHGQRSSKTSSWLKGTWGSTRFRETCAFCYWAAAQFWVIYPLCCSPPFHRMEITFDRSGGGWKDPLQFLKSTEIHKWRVQHGPWKYHLHLALPPLGLSFANNRRQSRSNWFSPALRSSSTVISASPWRCDPVKITTAMTIFIYAIKNALTHSIKEKAHLILQKSHGRQVIHTTDPCSLLAIIWEKTFGHLSGTW